jgi:formate dehydrogenase major subunit
MEVNRREFLKVSGSGVVGLSLLQLGVDVRPVRAYAQALKIEGAKEVVSVCPFCSVSCHIIAHVRDGKLISTEGDPDYPINQGALCAKGASMLSMTRNEKRLKKPMYRAPGSAKWEEKTWEWTFEQIASRVKKVRDKDLILKDGNGQTVNRLESMFFIGTSHADNEECAIAHQMVRGLGIVHVDHQART